MSSYFGIAKSTNDKINADLSLQNSSINMPISSFSSRNLARIISASEYTGLFYKVLIM